VRAPAGDGYRATALGLFAALGGQVGVWASQLPALAHRHGWAPGRLGVLLAVASVTSVCVVVVTGRLTDRFGRRGSALSGLPLYAVSFAGLPLCPRSGAVPYLLFACYGVASGLLDLAANAVGSDLEAHTGRKLMVGLHAAFSGGAAVGAALTAVLSAAGWGNPAIFRVTALCMLLAVPALAVSPYPPHHREEAAAAQTRPRAVTARQVLARSGVLMVILVGTMCFFGDGILQSFAPLYLQQGLGTTAVGTALGVALFHMSSLCGRLCAVPLVIRQGNDALVLAAGATAAALGVGLIVFVQSTWPALAGMAFTGFVLSPVIPLAYSLLGKMTGAYAGSAISVLAACSYAVFTAAPAVAGGVAEQYSLRVALWLAICCYGGCALFALGSRRKLSPHPSVEESCVNG
jgi:MFS family permease